MFGMESGAPLSTRMSTSISDNQAYPQVCALASIDYRVFNNFRRDEIYTTILEHVSPEQGQEYLEIISKDAEVLEAMPRFRRNDDFGNPRTFAYPAIGEISPSTLRYVKVLTDLKAHFKTLDGLDICEIGVGYGGQCRIVNAFFRPATYCLVDISPALALARRYLDNYILSSVVSYKSMNELAPRDHDLVISNYAFTELPRAIQDVYLQKVILQSKRGYITYNEITPPEFNSYKSAELLKIIPNSTTLEERPLTHPKNCIIVWGKT
jgi:putative sugar O-methyltransferase